MEENLKVVQLLSLTEMSLRRVSVLLWRDTDVLLSISKIEPGHFTFQRQKQWQETVEDKIKEKITKLDLPKLLMKKMIDIIKPIGLEIRNWKEFHKDFISPFYKKTSFNELEKICWTMSGTINYQKTAEEFVKCDALIVDQLYRLACLYCLEEYIPFLWEELPDYMKKHFDSEYITLPHQPFVFPHILKGELSKLDHLLRISGRNLLSLNQYAFEYSAEKGNKAAAEYFFQKLTHKEKEASLMRTAIAVLANGNPKLYKYAKDFPKEKFYDVFYYLLTLMTSEQQKEIIVARPVEVFVSFLYWPRPNLFLENASLMWNFLPSNNYKNLMFKMLDVYAYSGFYFPKMYQEFILQSPPEFKKCLIDPERAYSFLSMFFDNKDSETIRVVFRIADATERVRFLCHIDVIEHFYICLVKNRWPEVELVLQEAMLSTEDKVRVKKTFREYLKTCTYAGETDWQNGRFKKLSDFLDGMVESKDE